MDEMIRQNHAAELVEAKILLYWHLTIKPDKDNRVVLGYAQCIGEREREATGYDFIIVLNSAFWHAPTTTDVQRKALIDHELCHCRRQLDEAGEQRVDEAGKKMWRIRKHDCEEFREIIDRHGIYKADLEAFAATLVQAQGRRGRQPQQPQPAIQNN